MIQNPRTKLQRKNRNVRWYADDVLFDKKMEPHLIKSFRHRVPDNVSEDMKILADRSMERLSEVLEGSVPPDLAGHVIKAAGMLREEICGSITKSVDVRMSLEQMIAASAVLDSAEDELDRLPPPDAIPPDPKT